MKCQNCGQNEANFFQRSNINGEITELALCTECAEKLGHMHGFKERAPQMLESFMGGFGGFGGFYPSFFGFGPRVSGVRSYPDGLGAAMQPEQTAGVRTQAPEPDEELIRLRELNVLRERMRLAARNEDFERAIELREQIKQIEG